MDTYYPFHLAIDKNAHPIKQQLIDDASVIAFFDSQNIICEAQIKAAMFRATRSFTSNKAIANVFNIELMLHLAGTHQIKKAIKFFEVQSSTREIIILSKKVDLKYKDSTVGFPSFDPGVELLDKFGMKDSIDPCKEIISLGARLVTDYE